MGKTRSRVLRGVGATGAVTALVLGGGTLAQMQSTATSSDQRIDSGDLSLTCDGGTFDNPIRNISAGDKATRTMTIVNSGSMDFAAGSVSLTPISVGGTLLTTSPEGVALRVLDGTREVLPSTKIASWTGPLSLDLTESQLASGASTNLTFEWQLPAQASNAFQGLSDSVAFQCQSAQAVSENIDATIGVLPKNAITTVEKVQGVDLSWPKVPQAEIHDLRYRPTGFADWIYITVGPSNSYMSSLTPGTDYEVEVRGRGSNGVGPWGGTTVVVVPAKDTSIPSSALAPSGLSYTGIAGMSATASWNPVSGGNSGTRYEVRYSTDGSNWTTVGVGAGPSGLLSGLRPSTNYQTQIRWTQNGSVGDWSATVPLQTIASSWDTTTVSSIPTTRYMTGSAVVGSRMFVVGGDWVTGTAFEAYDTASNAWEKLAPMPVGVRSAAVKAVGTKVYVIGGQLTESGGVTTNIVQVYDTSTNTWSTGRSAPTKFGNASVALLDGKIHVMGGKTSTAALTQHLVYDPASDSWSSAASLPAARSDGTAATAPNGSIYYISGWQVVSQTLGNVWSYDPKANTWTSRANIPQSRYGAAASLVGNDIYVTNGVGVSGGNYTQLTSTFVLNTLTNTWSNVASAATPDSPYYHAQETVNGRIYRTDGPTNTKVIILR